MVVAGSQRSVHGNGIGVRYEADVVRDAQRVQGARHHRETMKQHLHHMTARREELQLRDVVGRAVLHHVRAHAAEERERARRVELELHADQLQRRRRVQPMQRVLLGEGRRRERVR